MFRSLWAYRGFVWSSVLREFNGKYRESLFGAFWSVASPLSMIIVYTVIFSQLIRATLPGQGQVPFAFSIYLCAGVITWGHLPNWLGLGIYTLAATVVAWAGYAWFQKTRRGFADVL
jgi:lipopolysaccharide transport system permease protein